MSTPRKAILTPDHLSRFQASNTYNLISSFIQQLNDSVLGVKLSDDLPISPIVQSILSILDNVEQLVFQTPPIDNKASRFGNPAFRSFYDKLSQSSATLHSSIPNLSSSSIQELSAYFTDSWGNRTRIDYGSGMELNFLCWLLCLQHLQVLTQSDHKLIVIRIFWRYIQVMRTLQSTYWLEPAGSHGVWGLDDYHFLPFLFGSAQLRNHKYIKPKSIHDPELVDEYAKDYMYLACIKFINSVKTASLRWHSPMLDDISAVKTWEKLNMGMLKMYHAEVLGKLPVVQHFLFGEILRWDGPWPLSSPSLSHDHDHDHGGGETGWGDCCGIPVPSVFGAAAEKEESKMEIKAGVRLGGVGIRPVPFD